jgi:hypothetical protein
VDARIKSAQDDSKWFPQNLNQVILAEVISPDSPAVGPEPDHEQVTAREVQLHPRLAAIDATLDLRKRERPLRPESAPAIHLHAAMELQKRAGGIRVGGRLYTVQGAAKLDLPTRGPLLDH